LAFGAAVEETSRRWVNGWVAHGDVGRTGSEVQRAGLHGHVTVFHQAISHRPRQRSIATAVGGKGDGLVGGENDDGTFNASGK